MGYSEVKFHDKDELLRQSTFLITGGAGFIGSHIAEYLLEHGAGEVRVFDNLSEGRRANILPFESNPRFRFIEGDICNEKSVAEAMQGVHFLSHQAGLGSVPRSIQTPLLTNEANVTGFLHVLDAARRMGVKRMVYASSSSVYGDHKDLPKVEENIGRQLSPYAVSKRINELYADVFSRTYGMELIGLRYFNIFGPRQRPDGPYAAVIPLFIQSIREGKTAWLNGDGLQTRDFTFVQNAVQANIRALFSSHPEACGKVYNVALGERVTVSEVYAILCELAGVQPNVQHREERAGDIRDSLADISKARKYIGYEPLVRMKEGLKYTYQSFQ